MMKKICLPIVGCLTTILSFSQQTFFVNTVQDRFNEAKEYFQKEQYNLAYPILKELRQSLTESDKINRAVIAQEVEYYAIVSSLKQDETNAELDAEIYADVTKNNARAQMMRFHLAEYLFRYQRFSEAIPLYEGANIANLSNREVADMKFHQGYSYFTTQQFAQAKPLLNAIRQVQTDPNYIDANYYYGFIAYRDKQYADALASFKIVENEEQYSAIVPFYIVQINYAQGKKDEAVAYAEKKLKEGKSQFYELELKQLIGHYYFEKKQYAKALPYLEEYVAKSKKVRREDIYELSYSYYQANNYTKAIDGFKQLSGKEDSLSQHAMYLLGDAYLKTGQKSNARNAFSFSSSNNSNQLQKQISRFNYGKLSYELGYQDEALKSLRMFLNDYPDSQYREEAIDLLVGALTNTNNYRDALSLLESVKYPTPEAKRLFPRILYGRATELINDGRLQDAEPLLDKALKDPNNASVLPFLNFWKGELAYRSNRIDDAIRYYNAYLSAGAPTAGEANERSVKYNLGYAYFRKENYTVANTFFEPLSRGAALNSDPITQDAYIRTADVNYMNRNFTQARSMYDKVIGYSWPSEDYATFQKAMIAGISNATEKVNLMGNLIRKFPQSTLVADANMEIANTYLAQERFREAIPFLNNIVNAKTGNTSLKPEALLKAGIAYSNANDNERAIAQYRQLLTSYPNSPEADDAMDNLKTIYVEQGRPGEFADVARSVGRPISVTAEDSLTFQAAELQYENKNPAALQALDNYLQRFPNGSKTVDAYFYRGEIYSSRKDWNNAISNYAEVAKRAPNTFAEQSILQAARLTFFELKNYPEAEKYYAQLKQITSSQETRLEAMRGLLRSQYLQKKWSDAVDNAKELIAQKGASGDDKSLANMAIGKSAQIGGRYDEAITAFKAVVAVNKAAVGAEARYEIANTWFMTGRLSDAEKAAFEVINKSGSYDFSVTKAYILLGDIYFKQKDYFNAKATFQSIVQNSLNAELKAEAQAKLEKVNEEEAKSSKVGN